MIKCKKQYIFVIIFIYILSIGLLWGIDSKIEGINGNLGYDKTIIRLRSSSIEEGLDKSKITVLKELIKDELMTYYTFYNTRIESEFNSENILLYGIGGDFKEFYSMDINGSFLTGQSQYYGENIIVLEDKLAGKLFGTTNVQGLTVELNGKKFKVMGVVSLDKSIVDKVLGKDQLAFIPLSAMKDINLHSLRDQSEIPITNLEISMVNTNFYLIEDMVRGLGISDTNFIIENLKFDGLKITQKRKILLFLISCIVIYQLIIELFSSIRTLKKKIKMSLEEDYFLNIIMKKWKIYMLDSLKIIILIVSIVFVWKIGSFRLHIEPNKIPTDPTSLNEIINTFTYNIRKCLIRKDNIYAFTSYRKSRHLFWISRFFWAIGFICSIRLFNYIKKYNKHMLIKK